MESWQRTTFFVGVSGSGKGTTAGIIMSYLPLHRVGLIENVVEPIFTLQGLQGRWHTFALDLAGSWVRISLRPR
jgi:hypothetical protein